MPRPRRRARARDYGPDWAAVAHRVKCDAHWRCERCGAWHQPSSGHCLTVAHLDHEYDNQRWNLAALCQRCHLMYECKFHFRQGYMFEHSAWMVPHVEGWRFHVADELRRRA